ncbi:hypothetical protein SeMB42_g03662 [Synchytrium endobioticum]|uniref:Uncharacterized protein n=1 Tax=Synchytrium endobioticum TaxID=286115 RepID=A0A507D5E6_9FUNG|nr:hypothetical protein SeMB42_g03662 [Synchytrium endobioticum]TPX46813.1 hypothetical protein SeLEV6574_g03015 [Synchytrium endobioticum]
MSTTSSPLFGNQEASTFDFATVYGYTTSTVHRWTRLAVLFYCVFQGVSFIMRAACASTARINGTMFAAAQSTDIVAFYILVAIVFNQDRRPKKYGDHRRAKLKQVIRWGGNLFLLLVMILGFGGALVAGGNWVHRADQMMQSSAVFMAGCAIVLVCLVLHSMFAPRFDHAAARVKEIDADLKATLVLILVSLALLVVSGYRVGATFVPSIRIDQFYFSINFLLELCSAVLLSLPITAGHSTLEADQKANEARGLMGQLGILSKPDLARAGSYRGSTKPPSQMISQPYCTYPQQNPSAEFLSSPKSPRALSLTHVLTQTPISPSSKGRALHNMQVI